MRNKDCDRICVNGKFSKKYQHKMKIYCNYRLIKKYLYIGHKEENMFNLHSEYKPTGDQPQAIEKLSQGIKEGKKFQTLLGVTGSRKDIYNS